MNRRHFLAASGAATLGLSQEPAGADTPTPARLRIDNEDLYATAGGRPVLRYRRRTVEPSPGMDPLLAGSGFLHPVHAPNGALVTDHLSPDHPHQRGIFSAWTKTHVTVDGKALEPDFWNIHQGTGRTRSEAVEVLNGSEIGFRTGQVFEARAGDRWVPVLDETWEVHFAGAPSMPDTERAAYVSYVTSRQVPRVAIELPKYHYGGFAVRGARQWAKGSDISVLTSEGKDRTGADQVPARWIDMSGTVDGKLAGVTLLEHPGNPHAPNGVRMHDSMPYYVFALPQAGPITLQVGKEYVFRYCVVAHNGRPDREWLETLRSDFTSRKS